jgi:transglutaminase-like putative cysteine protease
MKPLLAFLVTVLGLISSTSTAVAQHSGEESKSPKQVLEAYLAMETRGGRLSKAGWTRGDSFFAGPVPMPRQRRVVVISEHYSVYETSVNGDRAELSNDYEDLGLIDSALHYTAPAPEFLKTTVVYHLVNTHPHGTAAETLGWRITDPGTSLWLNRETAMRYVLDMRDKTSDPTIRKNADHTLAILRQHH